MKLIERVEQKTNYSECMMRPVPPAPSEIFRGGYLGTSKAGVFIGIVFNRAVAAFMLLLFSPIILLVALLIKLFDPGPVFYRGARLGYQKRIFYMYKFRTLPVGSQEKIGSELYSSRHERPTLLGNFLRETRLDELPQFLNVLTGDMVLVGPRPIRPEVYERLCSDIHEYDLRFSVRPGLVGYAQLFTPHSAPKRIRAHIDNRLSMRKRSLLWDMVVLSYAALVLLRNLVEKLLNLFFERVIHTKILKKYQEQRRLERVRIKQATVSCATRTCREGEATPKLLELGAMCFGEAGDLRDMNEKYFRFWSNEELEDEAYRFRLERPRPRGRGIPRKRAYCMGRVFRKRSAPPESGYVHEYVIDYEGETQLQQYMLDKYFLEKSIA